MNIPKSMHKLPDAPPAVARAEAEASIKQAAETLSAGSANAVHEELHAMHEEAHAIQDTMASDCPGKGKPTIVELFPEQDFKDGVIAQTLRFPEDGESPMLPPSVRTTAMGESGDDFKPVLRTAAMGESGEGLQHKPGDLGSSTKTMAIGEGGEDWGRFHLPGKGEKDPGHFHLPGGGPINKTMAIGEGGEDRHKHEGLGPINKTMAIGEGGEDWGKPFHPGKSGGLKPWFNPPISRTLAYPESGEDWGKLLKEGHKPYTSPPCKCIPDEGFPPMNGSKTMAFTGEGGDDFGPSQSIFFQKI